MRQRLGISHMVYPGGTTVAAAVWGFAFRAERRAAPKPARLAMCERLNAASIAVPLGDRSGLPAFSAARLGEGRHP
jgi:hypothetical protein